MKKLKRLPAFALVAIAIGAALLVSGSAYAAYQLLWPKPNVQVSAPEPSISGRQQVAISFADCGGERMADSYELKRNATITADQIAGVIKAHCELNAIGAWAQDTFPHDKMSALPKSSDPYNSTMVTASFATHIKSRDAQSITFVGLTKYMQEDKTFMMNDKVRYIVDGHEATANDITLDDPVAYIMSDTRLMTPTGDCSKSCSISGSSTGESTLLAVVKLSLPFENYDQFAWQSLAERNTCYGNDQDTCLSGYVGGIDLFQGNAQFDINVSQMKEIQGVVTALNGASTTIKSSSGRIFTITTPSDVVASYNQNRSATYNNQTVKIGSTLAIQYTEATNEHSLNISASQLSSMMLRFEYVGKSDAPSTY